MNYDIFGDLVHPQESKPQTQKQIRMQIRNADGSWKINPMLKLYGEVPGKKCNTCSFLFYNETARKYYKCSFRKNTYGPASDHRKFFSACGKYAEKD